MNAEDQSAASDATEQPEPETTGTEQQPIESTGLAGELLKVAREEGHDIGFEPPKAEVKPATDDATPEATETTQDAGSEDEGDDKSDDTEAEPEPKVEPVAAKKPDDKGDKLVPLREVLEERDKKRRANERAERAEALAEQLQAQLQQVSAPQPTEDDPFRDVTDPAALDRLERSYEKSLDLAESDPDALVAQYVEIEKKKSGVDLLEKYTPEQLLAITKRKAERAVRKQIPERRKYLEERGKADAYAATIYPELQDPQSEFTQAAAVLAQRLLSGQAMKDPTLLVWIGHAVRGWQASQKENGNGEAKVKSPEAKKIVQAARQKVAPTPTRTRSFVERGSSSVNLEKAKEKLAQQGTPEAAEELVAAVLGGSGQSKRLEPIAE